MFSLKEIPSLHRFLSFWANIWTHGHGPQHKREMPTLLHNKWQAEDANFHVFITFGIFNKQLCKLCVSFLMSERKTSHDYRMEHWSDVWTWRETLCGSGIFSNDLDMSLMVFSSLRRKDYTLKATIHSEPGSIGSCRAWRVYCRKRQFNSRV